jgi:hypothetical protein
MKKQLILASFLMITGCAIDTGVIPLNNHTFTITKQAATGFTGIDVVKQGVLQEATKYCANLHKTLKIITSQQTQPPYIAGNFPRADMTFSCESNQAENTTAPNVSHNKNINCNTDTDCLIGFNCRFQSNSFGNVCKPTESKYSDELTSETAKETQKPLSSSKPINLENFKAQCKELGFKVGTQDFGNCVLELNDAK